MTNNGGSSAQVVTILQLLLPKTRGGQAIWLNDGDTLTIHLPTFHVLLGTNSLEEEKIEYYAIIASLTGREIARATVMPGDPQYDFFQQMYTSAREASLARLASEVQKLVFEQEIIGTITTSTTTTAPPGLPAQPTVEQAETFLDNIKGEWHLDYSHGQEDITIDANGSYFVLSMKHGKPISTTPRPKFRIELLSCNFSLTTVEIAKVLPNGRTFQIEVLDVTTDKISGYAKHDGHRLLYTRR